MSNLFYYCLLKLNFNTFLAKSRNPAVIPNQAGLGLPLTFTPAPALGFHTVEPKPNITTGGKLAVAILIYLPVSSELVENKSIMRGFSINQKYFDYYREKQTTRNA